jgi:peptide/nickel transport system substrate-binding protein
LQPGIVFHDGAAFDADAVQFNFERMLDDKPPHHNTGPFPLAFFFDMVEDARAVEPYTVQFILKAPFAPFLSNLAYPTGFIISPTAVRRHGKAYGRYPVGAGPFRFVEWSAHRRVVLERFTEYHGQPSKSEVLVFRPISDPMTHIAGLMAGGVDVVMELSPE